MIGKSIGGLGLVLGGIAWFSGAFSSGYSRKVERPLPDVMAALADLDITQQPGSPGTDPSMSGGVRPLIKLQKSADTLTWTVMSGDKVATRMIARLEPIDNGAHTRVTTDVERGDAPDDFVSPAFRSKGITMGLFGMALESELNQLTAPPRASREACQQLVQKLLSGQPQAEPSNLVQAIGGTAKTAIRLNAVQAELRQRGCPTDGPAASFEDVEKMEAAPPPAYSGSPLDASKPMTDAAPTLDVTPR